MFKKDTKKYIVIAIAGFALGCIMERYLHKVSMEKKQYAFKYCGNKNLSVNLPKTKFGYVEDESVRSLKYGIVNNPIEAARISKLIIDDVYGDGNMKCPIRINRNNNEIWTTEGSPTSGICGGTVSLQMLRSNCMILWYMGTK